MTSSQVDRISVPTPVRVFSTPGTTCQLYTSDWFVEVNVPDQAVTAVLPSTGGPYTIIDGAGAAATYPITIENSSGATVGTINANGGSLSFGWDGGQMIAISQPAAPTPIATYATIAALREVGSGTPISPVIVSGYYSAGDGGGGIYSYVSSDTSSADNGGTIIVDAGDHRWYLETFGLPYSARQFGVKADGSTDDSAALQAAINALPANGGTIDCRSCATIAIGSSIIFGNGTSAAASTKNGITALGAGGDDAFGGGATTLKWIGASGSTVVEFAGAMLGGGMLGNWIIDGNSLAANGLIINHVADGEWGNIKVQNCTGVFVWMTTQTSTDPYGGCRNNKIGSISVPSLPSSAYGLKMDAGILTIPGDILQNRIGVLDIANVAENGATALHLGWADFNVFDIVDITGTTGGTSVGVLFKGQDTSHYPFLNKFGCYANSMGETSESGQLPFGNFIEVYDYPDSGNRIPTAAGLSGFANFSTGTQNLSLAFGFTPYGFDTTTPSLPGGTGTGNEVTNSNTYPVSIYMAPSTGSVVTSAHIIDVHGTDSQMPGGNYVRLKPGEKIYFGSTVAGAWLWYGEVF